MSETPMTDKTVRDIQSEIARVIPEPRNLVTRLEYARRVLAIPEIKEGQELREKAKSGKAETPMCPVCREVLTCVHCSD